MTLYDVSRSTFQAVRVICVPFALVMSLKHVARRYSRQMLNARELAVWCSLLVLQSRNVAMRKESFVRWSDGSQMLGILICRLCAWRNVAMWVIQVGSVKVLRHGS